MIASLYTQWCGAVASAAVASSDQRIFNFNVEYFDVDKRTLGRFDRKSQFILVPAPKQFKKEFKFYFLDFFSKPLNDSIESGVIK